MHKLFSHAILALVSISFANANDELRQASDHVRTIERPRAPNTSPGDIPDTKNLESIDHACYNDYVLTLGDRNTNLDLKSLLGRITVQQDNTLALEPFSTILNGQIYYFDQVDSTGSIEVFNSAVKGTVRKNYFKLDHKVSLQELCKDKTRKEIFFSEKYNEIDIASQQMRINKNGVTFSWRYILRISSDDFLNKTNLTKN